MAKEAINNIYYIQLIKRIIPIFITLVVIYIVYWLIETSGLILLPILIGYLYALAFESVVYKKNRENPLTFAFFLMVMCFLLEILVIALVPYLIVDGISLLKNIFPSINSLMRWFIRRLGEYDITIKADSANLIIPQITQYLNDHGQEIIINITTLLQALIYLLLAPIFGFYFLLYWHKMGIGFCRLMPRPYRKNIMNHVNHISGILAKFLRGQSMVSLILLIYYTSALYFIGLKNGLIIGFITGIICFVPFLGFFTSLALATITALTDYHNGLQTVFLVWAVYGIGNIMEGFVLSPRLIGKSMGLKPVVAIISILLMGNWFGLIGIIFAIPIASIMLYLFKVYLQYYKKSELYLNGISI